MSTYSEKADIEQGKPAPEAPTPTGTPHIFQDYAALANHYTTAHNGAPLDRQQTIMLPAFGGAFQPAPYKPSFRKFANPAPLGLCAFALTTFVLSLINAKTRGIGTPSVVVGTAYAYGGVVQLLAGMWEMAVGNTFGATALSSYGGFWISWAMIETDFFGVISAYESKADANTAVGFFLAGWFIFTCLCLLCTFKSTLAFCSLFFFLDITFLLLTVAHFQLNPDGSTNAAITKAAGIFGLITSFLAWWNAAAGMLERSNSFFTVPVLHFPWSEKVKEERANRAV